MKPTYQEFMDNAIDVTEYEYKGYKIVHADSGENILELNKIFPHRQAACAYIDAINSTIKDLYIAVCSGDYNTVKAYFDNPKTARLNRRYKTRKGETSLIMAALNNKMYDICTYLLNVGETVTEDEYKELQPEISRAVAVAHIFHYMKK